jgi:CRISPR-associated endonuclease/helicase Cas3
MSRRPLRERLKVNSPLLDQIRGQIPPELLPPAVQVGDVAPIAGVGEPAARARRTELFTRLLFSALVDADRLATAAFYAHFDHARTHDDLTYDKLPVLLDRLRTKHAGLPTDTPVAGLRREILDACVAAADARPGIFSLCAPTGGGKTLSGMRFALEHAVQHGLRRVIVVIPYTSIIEQNARVYRDIFGVTNVLEHHSNLDEEKLDEWDSEGEILRKLAAENWNSPIVVTTSVQFFESLFSDHPSRCRKLHNVARSVVILDELQTLPPGLLHPILDVLGELAGPRIGCSVVLSTATPPALLRRDELPFGLSGVHPILPEPASLADRARRVRVSWEVGEPTPYDALAARLAGHEAVLAIVHRRQDARELAEALEAEAGPEGLFHLSALMCPAHRLDVLARIKAHLDGGLPCRVVSTQLVEAGVDLDFPVVYRTLAGLDSLAQAAGRCDREGRLTEANRLAGRSGPGGHLIVFEAPTPPPKGVLEKAAATTRGMLANRGGALDIFDPAVCERFFELLYGKEDLDARRVQLHRKNLDFLTTAHCFRMIDSDTRPIAVLWGEGAERIKRFRAEPNRTTQRALQPFIVQVSRFHRDALWSVGVIEAVHERVDVLLDHYKTRYGPRFGLDPLADGVMDPEVGIV